VKTGGGLTCEAGRQVGIRNLVTRLPASYPSGDTLRRHLSIHAESYLHYHRVARGASPLSPQTLGWHHAPYDPAAPLASSNSYKHHTRGTSTIRNWATLQPRGTISLVSKPQKGLTRQLSTGHMATAACQRRAPTRPRHQLVGFPPSSRPHTLPGAGRPRRAGRAGQFPPSGVADWPWPPASPALAGPRSTTHPCRSPRAFSSLEHLHRDTERGCTPLLVTSYRANKAYHHM